MAVCLGFECRACRRADLVEEAGCEPGSPDTQGQTCFMAACICGHLSTARYLHGKLVEQGRIDTAAQPDLMGGTPLHLCEPRPSLSCRPLCSRSHPPPLLRPPLLPLPHPPRAPSTPPALLLLRPPCLPPPPSSTPPSAAIPPPPPPPRLPHAGTLPAPRHVHLRILETVGPLCGRLHLRPDIGRTLLDRALRGRPGAADHRPRYPPAQLPPLSGISGVQSRPCELGRAVAALVLSKGFGGFVVRSAP